MIYLIAVFLVRFLPFDDCFYSTLSIPLLEENCLVTDLGEILLKFRVSSCFKKHSAKFFKGYK